MHLAYYPPETRVTHLATIRRQRVLPVPGTVVAQVGERVEPAQVVARAELPADFRILPVARSLGVPPSKARRYLLVKPQDEVRRGQVIARRGRLFGNPVKSPVDGTVVASGGGRLLIQAHPSPLELRAHIQGQVTGILERYGVVIETTGALAQGVWGAGGENQGILKCIVSSPDEPLQAEDIDPSCYGTILVAGFVTSDAVLERAQEFQVRGIVVGALLPALLSRAEQLPLPLIVTDCIGQVPMSRPIFQLLQVHDGREAAISGQVRPRWGVVRPEIIIPLPADTLPASQAQPEAPLAVGARVRLVQAPYVGAMGTVVALPAHARRIETGARVHGAQVDVGLEAPVFVPVANLEILR